MHAGHQDYEDNHHAFLFAFLASSYPSTVLYRLVEFDFWYLSRLWQFSHS
jgi:hypothetical protein